MRARTRGRGARPASPHAATGRERPAHTTGPARATHEWGTAGLRRRARFSDVGRALRRQAVPHRARMPLRRRPDARKPPATAGALRSPEPKPRTLRTPSPPLKKLPQMFMLCSDAQVTSSKACPFESLRGRGRISSALVRGASPAMTHAFGACHLPDSHERRGAGGGDHGLQASHERSAAHDIRVVFFEQLLADGGDGLATAGFRQLKCAFDD